MIGQSYQTEMQNSKKKTVSYHKASGSKSRKETSQPKQSVPNIEILSEDPINLKEIDDFLDNKNLVSPKQEILQSSRGKIRQSEGQKLIGSATKKPKKDPGSRGKNQSSKEVNNDLAGMEEKVEDNVSKLSYKLKNKGKEYPIKEVNEKMKCPICKAVVKNLGLHFEKNSKCGKRIDLNHFVPLLEKFRK